MKKVTARHAAGYTLVEIMIAMLIALIIMGGVYRVLMEDTVAKERGEEMLEMQNNARVAMDRIVRDVRRAGFLGCGGNLAVNTLSNNGSDVTVAAYTLDGSWHKKKSIISTIVDEALNFDYLGEALAFSGDAPAGHARYQVGTDALTLVFFAQERVVVPLAPATATTEPLTIKRDGFSKGDIIMVTDCTNYSLFQKTNCSDNNTVRHTLGDDCGVSEAPLENPLNASTDLLINYGLLAPARAYRLTSSTYYIRQTDPAEPTYKGFGLYHNANTRPIANNIEDLQFQFLFDESCAGIACVSGDGNLSDEVWQDGLGAHTSKEVRAVRVWVLAMSEPDYGYTDTDTYDYPNSPYAVSSPAALAPINSPSDGEHRRRYLTSAVVYLRNAGL